MNHLRPAGHCVHVSRQILNRFSQLGPRALSSRPKLPRALTEQELSSPSNLSQLPLSTRLAGTLVYSPFSLSGQVLPHSAILSLAKPLIPVVPNKLINLFYSGETAEEALTRLDDLRQEAGVDLKGVLQPAVEEALTPAEIEKNVQLYLRYIYVGEGHDDLEFLAVKPTALVLRDTLRKFADSSYTINPIDDAESLKDIYSVFDEVKDKPLNLFFDAEQIDIQAGVQKLYLHLKEKYPQIEIYDTCQSYLTGSPSYFNRLRAGASTEKPYCVKLVKGAYLSEDKHAILPGFETVHENYKKIAADILKDVQSGKAKVVFATHNAELVAWLQQQMKDLQILDHPNITFAQLDGMGKSIGIANAKSGFKNAVALFYGNEEDARKFITRRLDEMLQGFKRTCSEAWGYYGSLFK